MMRVSSKKRRSKEEVFWGKVKVAHGWKTNYGSFSRGPFAVLRLDGGTRYRKRAFFMKRFVSKGRKDHT